MKRNILIAIVLVLGLTSATFLADVPQASISNGKDIKATLYLPDAQKGYYQATRFDWAGIIPSLEYKGHTFFGKWSDGYGPKVHDAVMGPAEAFAPVGYKDANVGGTFIRIGVGILRKPQERAYSEYKLYDIVDGGKWTVNSKADRVEFTQVLKDSTGYALIYKKTVRLVKGKPQMVIDKYSIKNTGTKVIETEVFNHNFPVIDNEPTGPNMKMILASDIVQETGGRGWGTVGKADGKEVVFLRTLAKNEQLYSPGIKTATGDYTKYDYKIQNQKTGAGMHVTSEQPLSKFVYWACPTTGCPEPYVAVKVEPGKEMKWDVNFEFYTFTPDKQ